MAGITVTCYGVCKGDPKWRDPETGLGCSLCGTSGKVTTYNQRELADAEWESFKKSQATKAERRAGVRRLSRG
jgi:hypothetical protein